VNTLAIKQPPKFISSEYFIMNPGKWELKPGAPKEVRNEFDKHMSIVRKERQVEDPDEHKNNV
jgi:hypothetical protein